MMILETLTLLVGLGAAPQSSHADERVIPAAFQGEWNERVEDCGTGNNDSRLRISSREVRFYESGGRVRGAFLHGPYELIIVLDMSGEGQTWMASHHFILASDGSYLSAKSDDGSLFTRYRCPTG